MFAPGGDRIDREFAIREGVLQRDEERLGLGVEAGQFLHPGGELDVVVAEPRLGVADGSLVGRLGGPGRLLEGGLGGLPFGGQPGRDGPMFPGERLLASLPRLLVLALDPPARLAEFLPQRLPVRRVALADRLADFLVAQFGAVRLRLESLGE